MMTERAFNGNRIATKRVFIGVGHGAKTLERSASISSASNAVSRAG